jgi:hypothetical protein
MDEQVPTTLEARMARLELHVSQALAKLDATERALVEIADSMLAAAVEANCTAENALKTLQEVGDKVIKMLEKLHDEPEPTKTPQIM